MRTDDLDIDPGIDLDIELHVIKKFNCKGWVVYPNNPLHLMKGTQKHRLQLSKEVTHH